MLGKYSFIKTIKLSCIALLLCSCGDISEKAPSQHAQNDATESSPEPVASKSQPTAPPALTAHYLQTAEQLFNASCSNAEQLQISTQKFLSTPSKERLTEAKNQWIAAHNSYVATFPFRSIGIKHPSLDAAQINPVKHSIAVRIDQTPLLPGYIDEIQGYPKSGYVFSPLAIDRDTLNKEHQFADTAYVSLGFHVVEFLLWGEQGRSYTDFTSLPAKQEYDEGSADYFKNRRSQLLSLTTTLLKEDVDTLCKEWNSNSGYYPIALKELLPEQQLAAINNSIEQLISNIQIEIAKIRQSGEESKSIEQHSEFSGSDEQSNQAQITTLKSILKSQEWVEFSTTNEHSAKLNKLASTLPP